MVTKPWFLEQDINSIPGYIMASLGATFTVLFLLVWLWPAKAKTGTITWMLVFQILNFVVWSLFTLSIYSARFHYLLEHSNAYEPEYDTNNNIVWPSPAFKQGFTSSRCDFSLSGESPDDDVCSFLDIPLPAKWVQDSFAQAGIVLQLLFWIFLHAVEMVVFCKLSLAHVEQRATVGNAKVLVDARYLCKIFGLWCGMQVLSAQDWCALLPLTAVDISPLCASPVLPSDLSNKNAVCYFRWSICNFPIAVPVLLILVCCVLCSCGENRDSSLVIAHDSDSDLRKLIGGLVIASVGLLVFWFVGSIGIGIWVRSATIADHTLLVTAEMAAPALFVLPALLRILQHLLAHLSGHLKPKQLTSVHLPDSNDSDDELLIPMEFSAEGHGFETKNN